MARGRPGKVLGYFSEDDAVINLWRPAGTLAGKKMVAERWVIPTVTNYPGNVHQIKNFLEAGDQVAVEWLFTAAHVSTGKEINIPGCSVYIWRRDKIAFEAEVRLHQTGPPAPNQFVTEFLAVSAIELS